jgi:hypothetical protein
MRKTLRDIELNYSIIEKQACALVNSLYHFMSYDENNKIKAYVTYPTIKDAMSEKDCLGTRGKWVSEIHEYDLDIKPTKIIKGQGLAKMLIESNEEVIQMGENDQINVIVSELEHDELYVDIIYYWKNLACPYQLVYQKRTDLKLNSIKYCLT